MAYFNVAKEAGDRGITVLTLKGSLDAESVFKWESVLDDLLTEKKQKLLVDLGSLDYMSSAGIGTFIGCIGELRKKGGDIVFVNTPPRVLRVFKLLGFTELFKMLENKEEAARALIGD